jgi:transposase
MRFDLVLELLDDVRRLDAQTKESHRRIKIAVKASGTSVTNIYGVGPILAAGLIGYSGDIRRFANRDAYASYNGTAPIELSSGGRVVHRVSRRGNCKLNHNIHMASITQIRNPGTQGRIYFERKVAEGKRRRKRSGHSSARSPTPSTASCSSTPGRGVREDTQGRLHACVTGSTPCATGSSAKSLPNPAKPYAVVQFDDGLICRA